ncbi:protein-glutamate methylesterase/protein-glutamine glutaminase [Virgibacillus salexigens]|uniref:protein-glutamate methylesterase/protein-glutamine glutaminase n=1 Tax=Virgibacillus salexigens TaxID=61016 RepID=UPI00190CFD85|nr:chemotaxis response regulator protein-glutamate methylesterase [Virgibacillus salexigens]
MHFIRVIIIDDSAFMRKVLTDMLHSDDRIEVVGTARNGEDGLKKVKELRPDVVTLDIQMPIMDGITTLKELMNLYPVPVVMLSSATNDSTKQTVQAISSGAVDFIEKPSGPISLDIESMKQDIIQKVVMASRITFPVGERSKNNRMTVSKLEAFSTNYKKNIVAIGTSTGGPRALQQIIARLPATINAPILVVQHMPAGFTKSLAIRLDQSSALKVKEAIHGEVIVNGTVYIAPGNLHMKLKVVGATTSIVLTKEAVVNGHRPAVDTLFHSLAEIESVNKLAIILTGMGSDGTNGIKKLKETDENTMVIAESEETAIVHGMPKAAVRTNLVNQELPLLEISRLITKLV